jgi:DNA-binding IscR family transcriptional regulator
VGNHWNHVNHAIRKALMDVTLEDLTNPTQIFPLPDTSLLNKDEKRFAPQQSV